MRGGEPSPSLWQVDREGSVGIMRLSDDAVEVASEPERFAEAFDPLAELGQASECRSILLMCNRTCFSLHRHREFQRQMAQRSAGTSVHTWPAIEENWFHRIIAAIRDIPKPVLVALQGEISLPFLGVALACDARIISSDTVFWNLSFKYGYPPSGGIGLLLPLFVGIGRATELLMNEPQIDAATAGRLGLVSDVIAPEDLEREAVRVAQRWATLPSRVVGAIKRELNYHLRDLDRHFDLEMKEIERATAHLVRRADSGD